MKGRQKLDEMSTREELSHRIATTVIIERAAAGGPRHIVKVSGGQMLSASESGQYFILVHTKLEAKVTTYVVQLCSVTHLELDIDPGSCSVTETLGIYRRI